MSSVGNWNGDRNEKVREWLELIHLSSSGTWNRWPLVPALWSAELPLDGLLYKVVLFFLGFHELQILPTEHLS